MSRKTGEDSRKGLNDVIGVALLALALLLLVAQFSFDRNDISFLTTSVNHAAHNWIKLPGAYLAWGTFFFFGIVGYLLPFVLGAFGVAYLLNFLGYLRERLRWSLLWAVLLIVSLTGLLYLADNGGFRGKLHETIGAQSIGGCLGWLTYGQTQDRNFGFSLLGPLGATIVYSTLCVISLLFLTNFQLGEWLRAFFDKKSARAEIGQKSPEEIALEKRAVELEKQRRRLEEQVGRPDKIEKSASGLGADGLPVPEPMVRDLSVPQSKPATGARIRKIHFARTGRIPSSPCPPIEGGK